MKIEDNKSELERIKESISLWLKHWYYFVISMAVCLTIAFVYYKTKTPLMKVSAQVNLRQDESLSSAASVSRSQSLLSAFGFGGKTHNIEDETLKMSSQGFVKRIVRKFSLNFDYTKTEFWGFKKTKLYDKSPIVISVDEAVSDTIQPLLFTLDVKKDQTFVKMKSGRKVLGKYEVNNFPSVLETPLGAFTVSKSEYYDKYKKPYKIQVFYANFDFMAQIYKQVIEVDFEKKSSDLIQLSMNSENVVLAKKILNEVIDVYNAEWESDKSIVTYKAMDFINERLKSVYEEMIQADKAIQDFKNKNNLTDIEADVKYYLTMSGEMQPTLLESQAQLKMIDIIVDFVNDEKNKYALIPLSPNIATLAMADIIVEYNKLLASRNDMYKTPLQSVLVKDLDELVEAQRVTLLKSIDNAKKSLLITVDILKQKESEINNKIGKIPAIEKDYLQLRREQELQQTIYIFLLEMREEHGVKGVSLLPKLKVIDEPYVINKPIEPDLVKVALSAMFFGGIVFPLSAIYGFPLVNNYIRRRKEK